MFQWGAEGLKFPSLKQTGHIHSSLFQGTVVFWFSMFHVYTHEHPRKPEHHNLCKREFAVGGVGHLWVQSFGNLAPLSIRTPENGITSGQTVVCKTSTIHKDQVNEQAVQTLNPKT